MVTLVLMAREQPAKLLVLGSIPSSVSIQLNMVRSLSLVESASLLRT